ncbi:MAG TPA: NAD(P)-dependent oxidoreductase [Candidatus Sulfopaludibacter sp.]|nr:NAD(P)-dependent oxidoreductase [Candidatus Sulfopaludibacter sp.]
MKIAFIGLGRMGSGMARNLLRAGHELAVYNRGREKAEALADGARVADSPAAACRGVEAAITMLADDAAVEQMTLGDNGIGEGLAAGAVHVSASTISTALARRLAAEHETRGQAYLSAPVFGRPDAAEAKRLLVVAAGPAAVVDRCRPLFDAVGRQTFVAGAKPWQANAVKLCGNFMIASMLETFGEAFATLRKSNVPPHLFLEVMNALFGSPVYANYGRIVADEQFEPAGFALRLGLKDVRLVLETAQECASPMPLASLIRDHLLSGIAQGQAEMDWSSVARVIARDAGL